MPAAFRSCRSWFLTVFQLVDGVPWLIDGQHRIHARKTGPVDNGDQPGLDCEVCDGLNERQTAGRPDPCRLPGRVQ